jgi:hypothetical protein
MTEAELLDFINSKIKQNGKRAITGDVLNLALRSLLELIDGGTTVDWGDIEGTLSDQTDLQTALNNKVDKESGNRLITSSEITKLSGIQAGAEVNVNADWDATSGDAQIMNKPTIPNPANFVAKADYTPAHSVLVQQSGTGSPSSVPIGNNQILGRLSGGGSNIKGLSVSEVKGLLDLENTNTGDNFILSGSPVQSNAATGGSPRYYGFSDNANATVEINRRVLLPKACTLRNFYLRTSGTQPALGSHVFTILKNGVATAITLTVPAGSAAGLFSDTTNQETFIAGDEISIEAVNNASTTSSIVVSFSIGVA